MDTHEFVSAPYGVVDYLEWRSIWVRDKAVLMKYLRMIDDGTDGEYKRGLMAFPVLSQSDPRESEFIEALALS